MQVKVILTTTPDGTFVEGVVNVTADEEKLKEDLENKFSDGRTFEFEDWHVDSYIR